MSCPYSSLFICPSLPFHLQSTPPSSHYQARAIQEVSEAESSESTAARIQLDIAMQAPLIAVLLEEGSRGEGVGSRGERVGSRGGGGVVKWLQGGVGGKR